MKQTIPPARIIEKRRRARRVRSICRAWDRGDTARAYRMIAYATVRAHGQPVRQFFAPFDRIEKPGGKLLVRLTPIAPEYPISEITIDLRDSDHAQLAVIRLARPDYTPGRDAMAITLTLGEQD